jgi:SAM-dependent methyltransferase
MTDLDRIGWTPPKGGSLLDWGCGSGVAGRVVTRHFGQNTFRRHAVWDRSPLAVRYAQRRARESFPGLEVANYEPGPISVLVVSHVLNELDAPQRHDLLEAVARAETVIWVEPGTHEDSRRLAAVRELLRADFRIIAPCPHASVCGALAEGRERDWCHFFAKAPPEIFSDPEWARFAKEVGVDLRSLPYSYLVLDRRPSPTPPRNGLRLLGRPRSDKAAVRVVACTPDGPLEDRIFARRSEAALCRMLDKHPHTSWIEANASP